MDWLKKALGSIGSFFGGAVNQGVKTAERYVPGVRQAEQVVNRVAPQIQRPKLQLPQVPKINVDSVLRSFAKSQLNPQQYNQLIQSKDPLVGIGMGIQKVATPTNLARAAAFNPATTPIVMAGAKMGGPTTQESMQKIGSFAANAPIIKQGRQIINAAPIDPFGHKGESVVKFVNEGLVQPTLKQIGRFNDVTTGRSNYDEGLKGLAQYGSDALTIGSLAYTGGKALQLNKATTMAAAKKLAPGVAARQFGSGAAQNAVYQVAEGKKIKEISPLEVLLSGAAYAGLGTGLPLVNKLLHPAPKVVNNAITRKADDAYRKYTSKLIDDQANKFQAGKINEQQFRGFVIDDFQQRYGRNPSEADIQALMARPSAGLRSRGEQIIQQVRAGADPTNFRTQATAPTFPEAGRLRAEGINARVNNQTPGLPVRPQNAVADTAPQLPAHLQKAGYKLDPNDGMLYDKAGRQIDPGHAQMILEEPGLMQQEQAFARGDRATVAKIAKEHPGDARYQLLQQEKSVEKTLTAPVADTAPRSKSKIKQANESYELSRQDKASKIYKDYQEGKISLKEANKQLGNGYATSQEYEATSRLLENKSYKPTSRTPGEVLATANSQDRWANIRKTKEAYEANSTGKAIADTAPIPKELQPLAAEARKYKSAEEFVKSQVKRPQATDNVWQDTLPSGTQPDSIKKIIKSGGNPLYHDTNADSVLGILDSGQIKPSQAPFSSIAGQGKRVSTTRNFDNYSRYNKSPYRLVIDEFKTGQRAIPDNREEFESIFRKGVSTKAVNSIAIDTTNPALLADIRSGKLKNVIELANKKGITIEPFEGKVLPNEGANAEVQTMTSRAFSKAFPEYKTRISQLTDLYNQATGKGKVKLKDSGPIADTAPIPNKGKELSFDNPEEANFVKQYASTTKPKMAGEKKVGNQLESQIGKQYEAKGSVVDYVGFRKGMQDHGIDLTAANKDGSVDLIQAKVRGLEGSNKTLHERPVQAFYAASEEARKQFNRPVNRVIITTAKNVDDDAIKFANTHGITIITQNIDGTGQRVITKAAKDVVLPPATVKLSAEESRRIQNVIPVGRRAEFLSDLENPNSGISRAMGSVPPEKRLSMAEDWYKAVDPEGTYQLTSLKGMAHNLAQAKDVAAVKRVIADDIVNNKQLEGFNPLDLPLMKRLEQDPKFAQKVADATNESELRAVLNQVGGGGIYDPLLSNNAKLNKVLAETDLTTGQGFQPGQAKYAQASLPQTAQSSQTLPPEFRATIQRMDYQVVPNDETLAKAALQMAENPSKMQEEVLNLTLRRGLSKMHLGSGRLPDTDEVAKAMLVVDKLSREGDYTTANQVLEHLTKQSTELGRAVQLFSIYNKTTPEGIGKYAHSLIKQYNDKVRVGKQVKDVTDEQLQRFTERARALQDMPEGRPRDIQTAKLMRDVEGLIPASWQEKAAMYLYLSQLLFPKTAIRNIVGNTFMLAAEDISHLVGAPIDAVATMITKKPRTIYTPHILRQMGDLGRGFKMGVQEAVQGIDLRNIASGKYDVKPFVFKSKAGQVAEKALAIELTAFDRAFYEAARNNVIRDMTHGLAKSKGIPVGKVKPTQEILDAADAFGRYMTYQDDSALAKLATDMKHGLNKVTTGSDAFGLGSAVLNYPKTPSNLVLRGLDYSPAGFVRVFADIIKPMMMRGEKFNRTKFINDLTRATTGTVNLTVFGGVLQAVGIVTPGNKDSSKDVKAFEKSIGSGNYKFNVDGFKRFVFGGFNPDLAKPQQNDQLISYDWAQPLAIPFTAGAEIAQQMSSKKQSAKKRVASLGNVGAQIAEGAQTLTEQPLLQGMQKLFGSQNGINGGLALLQGVPASFVPSALRGARSLADNVSRETYSPDWTQGAKNQVINSIPGLSKILPARYTPLGDVTENYQNGTNNLFNVAFNPAFVSKYQTDEVQSEIQRLFGQTGSASVVPNLANNDYTINGQNYTLSGEQKSKFQEVMGKTANNLLGQLFNTSYYNNANDVNKQKMIQNVITDATSLAKETVVASADKTDSSVQRILSGGMPNYRPGGGNDPRSRYETALASYQDKVKNNEISEVGKIQQERSLNALKVKADFDADTVDLYSMSNKEIDAYIKSKQNGGDIFNKLLALDDSMVKAGYTSKFRDKYGRLRNLAGSSGSRKGRKVARAAIPKLRMPKIGRLPSGKLKVALKTKKPRALA